jgi:anti-sigma factor RsiW
MNKDFSCEELLELINSLIDGELQGEMLAKAEALIRDNPQCCAMFHTVTKTITLFRERSREVKEFQVPALDWDGLSSQVGRAADE